MHCIFSVSSIYAKVELYEIGHYQPLKEWIANGCSLIHNMRFVYVVCIPLDHKNGFRLVCLSVRKPITNPLHTLITPCVYSHLSFTKILNASFVHIRKDQMKYSNMRLVSEMHLTPVILFRISMFSSRIYSYRIEFCVQTNRHTWPMRIESTLMKLFLFLFFSWHPLSHHQKTIIVVKQHYAFLFPRVVNIRQRSSMK